MAKGRRSWLGRMGRALAYVAGVAAFLAVTSVVTLDILLNKPGIKSAVEGWIARSTGVEVRYDRLSAGVFPPAIAAKGLEAKAEGWAVAVDEVEVQVRVLRREIDEVVVRGARVRVQAASGEAPGAGRRAAEKGAGAAPGGGAAGKASWGDGFVLRKLGFERCSAEWCDAEGRRLGGLEGVGGAFAGVSADRPLQGTLRASVPGGGMVEATVSAGAFAEVAPEWTRLPVELRVSARVEDLVAAADGLGGAAAREVARRLAASGADGAPAAEEEWNIWATAVGTLHNGFSTGFGVSADRKGRSPEWKAEAKGRVSADGTFDGTASAQAARWDGKLVRNVQAAVHATPKEARADGLTVGICGGTVRAKAVSASWADGGTELALEGVQGVGVELGEVLGWAGVGGAGGLDWKGRVFFGGEASGRLGDGTNVVQSLKGRLQGKIQGLSSGTGDGGVVGRVLAALEQGGALVSGVLPGLPAAAASWRAALEANGGRVCYDVAEAEAVAQGGGRIDVKGVKVGLGGYWVELSGRVELAQGTLALSGVWAAEHGTALQLVGGDERKLALLPGGDQGEVQIPLVVKGTFDDVELWPDLDALLAHVQESDEVQDAIGEAVERGLDHLHSKDRENVEAALGLLQGLLGRP